MCCGVVYSLSGDVFERMITRAITNAKDSNISPAMNIAPYIVENQCGSSDMIQSMKAKVVVSVMTTSPGALTARILPMSRSSPVRSCSADHLLNRCEYKNQMAKKITARPMKKGTFR